MHGCSRLLVSLLLVSLTGTHLVAQPKASVNQPPDPFSIKRGSSFAASGSDASSIQHPATLSGLASDISEAEDIIRRNFIGYRSLRDDEMTKNALTGALKSLDPHSHFYDHTEWKELLDGQQSGYSGIGVTIAGFEKNGVVDTYVLSTFPGSWAARAQLRFGDRIIEINGANVSGRSPDDVRDRLRGNEGTAVRITVERVATLHRETFELKRTKVPQPSIPDYYMLRSGIGYIELSDGFNYTTGTELDRAISSLKTDGMRSLILDLRGNGGGIVDQAVKVAEKFLPAGSLILTQRGRVSTDNRVWRSSNLRPETMPLVVLVDEDTASASEIVAGALQDNDRALIIGEKTFGKGLVQSVIGLPGRTGLTLTTGRYLTPSGRSIQRDYSNVDQYDYFAHKTAAAAASSYFEARTITGRRVLGGDGILPDEPVKSETLTRHQSTMLDPLFFFVRELVSGRIKDHEAYRARSVTFGVRIRPTTLNIAPTLGDAFRDFATSTRIWKSQPAAADGAFSHPRLR